MVTMLPDYISPDVKSNAEKKLFEHFKEFQTNQKYLALHSLGVSEHIKNVFGEIDFVIICPRGVLCVEVKGGTVRRNNGIWEFQNRYGHVDKKDHGPFEQAINNMYSLRQYMQTKLKPYDSMFECQFASCVLMPDCAFEADGPDFIQDILFDNHFNWDLEDVVSQSFRYWEERLLEKHGRHGTGLEDGDIDRLAGILRGDFCFVPLMKDIARDITAQLRALTEDQYDALSGLSRNPRVLVMGMAGSGKTVLAMEEARRAAWEQKDVLYLCYNRNIAAYVQYLFDKQDAHIDVRTMHSLMMETCDVGGETERSPDFFYNTLPNLFLQSLPIKQYDEVIVDEGQDLLINRYVDCIEKLLKGGLKDGYWSFFYDPNQNIFNDNKEFDDALSRLRSTSVVEYELPLNCRNTKEIAEATTMLTNISQPQRAKVSSSVDPVLIPYNSLDEERQKLIDILTELRSGGLKGKDIAVLSPFRLDNPWNCMHGHQFPASAGVLCDHGNIWNIRPNQTLVTTISSFKGLEAQAVVVTDINHFADTSSRLLNYVGLSRAAVYLYILYSAEAEEERQRTLADGYRKLL